MSFHIIVLLLLTGVASRSGFSQMPIGLEAGVRGGMRLNGALDPFAQNRDESRSYTIGPTVELRMPWQMSFEADVLYQRFGDRGGDCFLTYCGFSRTRANSWQFPLIVKKGWKVGRIQPYAGIGYSPRRVGAAVAKGEQYRTGPVVPGEVVDYTIRKYESKLPAEVTHGLVAAAGIEFRLGKVKIAPEFRYVRWNRRFWEDFGSRGFFTGSNLNQYDIQLSIRR